MTSSFRLLIENLCPDNINHSKCDYAPYEFKNKISKMNSLFEGTRANDSKDLLLFIIETLHEELNEAKNDYSSIDKNLDQRNKILVFKNFCMYFMKNNKSIISDLFYGINYNTTQCGRCSTKRFDYQSYFEIIFPLEEVGKFKRNCNKQFIDCNMTQDSEVSLYDCFEYDRKVLQMSGDNCMFCNYCKGVCESSVCTNLSILPKILIIILNRGKGSEFNIKCNFIEDLNLSNYCEYNDPPSNYKLIGVITYINFGNSGHFGHFIAFCRDPLNQKWNRYNDSIVSDVIDFQKEIVDFAIPYILFYQRL